MDTSTRQVVADWIGRFLSAHVCQKSSAKEWILSNWKNFRNYASYNAFTTSWSGFDGFAALDVLTASQLAQLTATHNVFSNSSMAASITHVLSTSDVRYLEGYLDELSTLTLTPPFDHQVMYSVLETVLKKVNESFPDLCSPSLKDLFQVKLKMLLPVADANILSLIPTKIGCTDFQEIYKGLDSVHSTLDPDTQKAVYHARLNFLNGQVAKEGVACTVTSVNSRNWLQENFGFSSVYADYSDFIRLFPAFNGYEVTDLLTATHLAKLVVISSILTDSSRLSAKTDATNVMNTFQSRNVSDLQTFLYEVNVLAAQMNIVNITNVSVREVMLEGIFQILKPHFASMTTAGLESWFNGTLTLYLASITPEELRALPVRANCTQLQTIVKGLDDAFDQMAMETKTSVTQWIVRSLLQIGALECKATENWMTLSFRRFKTIANLTDFFALDSNFTGMAHLQELTAGQMAQLTLTQEVFLSVANIERVFDRLAEMPGPKGLAAYWDAFNIAYEEPPVLVLNISMEVKHTMLARTMEQLRIALPTFTDAEYDLWFKKRLVVVLPSMKADVLHNIPINVSCSAYKSLIAGINTGFSDVPEDGKRDVYHYIVSFLTQTSQDTGAACYPRVSARDWLVEYLGKFSMEASYAQLVSFFPQPLDAYVVLDLLTPAQIGDMMVQSDTLTRMDRAAQLIQFFQQSTPEDAQMILRKFTEAALREKISVLPDQAISQLLLQNYLAMMSRQMEAYTAPDWNATFQNQLRFLSPSFSKTSLALVIPQDYDSLVAIVAGLEGAHLHMTESSRRAVVLWIVQNLKALKGYSAESTMEWIQATWRSFFFDATLEEVKSTNEHFNPAEFLGFLRADQLMEYVMTSDALFNVTTMIRVLRSLEGKDSEITLPKMDEFLTKFNGALMRANLTGVHNAEVRQEMLTTLFTSLSKHFYTFMDLDYEAWFVERLKFLLPSMNADLLELIPADVSFPSYTAIIRSLDNLVPQFSPQTSHGIYNLIQRILGHQLNASETVFPGTYSNSQSFLQLIFYRFRQFANYTQLLTFYKDFNGYDVLDLLSARQMGEMMVVTNAIRNERSAVQILAKMETRTFAEMTDFIMEFNTVAEQKHLIVLPNPRIRDLAFETIFKSFQFSTFTAQQYAFWFGSQLQLFLPALNTQYLQLLPLDIDCQSHQNLVQALDRAYDHYTEEQKKAIHGRIFRFLESYHDIQGGMCSLDANSSQWITGNYGRFSAYANMEEFSSLNPRFDGMSAVSELSPEQLAQLTTVTGALADETVLIRILSNLNASSDLAKFFDTLNDVAPAALQRSVHAHLILSTAFQTIAAGFPKFQASDFAYWFQDAFQNVLYTVNETIIAEIPVSISCDSYHQILKGFNNIYSSLSPGKAPSVFGFCKAFLASKVKSGVACGSMTQNIQNWLDLNLGNFTKYAEYQDLLTWNQHFLGMGVLDKLAPVQLASFTLQSDAINKEEVMCQVLAQLQSKPVDEIYQYLDQFNKEAQRLTIATIKNEAVRKNMLTQFVHEIQAGYSAFSPQDWTRLFARLELLLPSAGETEIQQFLTHVSGCDGFRAMVASLSQVHPSMSPVNQQGVYRALFAFLENQYNATGSACASGSEGSLDWLQNNFGAFAENARYEDFTKLMASFNGFDIRDNLTSTQLAHVFFGTDVLDESALAEPLLVSLQSRPVGDVVAFVTEFVAMAPQGIMSLANTQVRDAMFNVIFSKVRSQFTTFSVSQYKDWFQDRLRPWLASINASALATLPKKIPCGVFQIIMAGLDSSFQHMSPASQHDVYSFARAYLTAKAAQGDDPCTENTKGSLGWLQANWGSFGRLASYEDLVGIKADFSAADAVVGLSPAQLASYTLASDALRDSDKAGKIFSALNARTTGEFLDAFNAAAQQHHLTQLPHAEVRRFILGEIFCHMSTMFKHFSAGDYAVWFGERLTLFLSGLTAQNLGFLPLDMSCDSLATIVKILSDHKANGTFENPEDIVSFIKRVLHFQLQNSGSACAQGIIADRQWLLQYFGLFAVYGSYSDFTALKSKFQGQDSLDLLSASALAQLSAESNAIYSAAAIQLVFEAIGSKKEPLLHLSAYLDDLNALLMKRAGLLGNAKVRDTMLMRAAELVFPHITDMSLEDTTAWLHRLSLLLPGVNATTLELLPLSMPCPFYQAIIKSMSDVYSALPAKRRQDVYGFQKTYLNAQFADSGSACEDGTNGTRDWLQKNIGSFCSVAKLSELQTFYPDIDGIDVIATAHLDDVAEFLTKPEVIANNTTVEKIVQLIPLEDIAHFLNAAMSAVRKANLTDPQLTALSHMLLTAVWDKVSSGFSNFMPLEWRYLFQDLHFLLPSINATHLQLIPTNISCSSYQEIVKALNIHYQDYTVEMQQGIYTVLKNYLLQPGVKPKCYNQSDGEQNSTAWFLNYLGKYLSYCNVEDLRAFSDSQQLLQDFAVDPHNLALVGGVALSEDVKEFYSELIARQNPPVALGSIPDNLICYVVRKLNTSQTAATAAMATPPALRNCLSPSREPAGEVTGTQPDTAGNLSVETFQRLGPLAVRLTPSVLLANTDGQTLEQVLPTLSAAGGWGPAQASIILKKVLRNGYQLNEASSVLTLGTLALGLPANGLDKLDPKDILLLAADQNFTQSMEQALVPVKHKFVQRILQSTPGNTLLNIPDQLADQIPLSRLASPLISTQEINQKKWTPTQASVFFQAILKSTQQYSSLSSSVLQGFSCGAANFLNSSPFASLAKAMKDKQIRLEDNQLSCMTKRLTGQITPSDFEDYPPEVLFYMGPDKFSDPVNCQKYFHLVGQAHVDLLPRVSSKRRLLLERAKACLGTPTLSFSKENLLMLGNLCCALNGSDIVKSDPSVLTRLQSCRSFTEDQPAAIEQQLENKYGSPSTWTVSTLTDMGLMASTLRSGTLQRIPETEKMLFFPDFLSQLKTWNRDQFTYILDQLAKPQRQKRAATGCTRTSLTTEMVVKQRDLLVSTYTSSSDLDACLPDDVLSTNLETLGKLEFQDPLLQVLKLKLDKIFGTPPEDYLPLLGNIARMYTPTEIANWNITAAETLAALLAGTSWQKDLPKVKALVTRHLEANGHQLDGAVLTILAPHICAMEDAQIRALRSEAIRETSRPLNTSLCSQQQKNLLYGQLRAAYEENQNAPDAYYRLLRPVIGGAPATDLIRFASGYPVMDVDTFTALNPEAAKKLSTQNLKDLLGANLPELNNLADDPVVKAWAQAHRQSEVNSLGLHLVAGLPDQPPNGIINIPGATHIPGRATTYAKNQMFQLFYCVLFSWVLTAF
ncbi:uncharacterized protein LOC102455891 isoform X2 [Pelodiscus sinensis]|uniref:uncharacterized protein LOC102455891 isoform X2 n=1 Tax=Pelodiscus sinensis TaxID=13735 RepID=UPI003F6B7CBC